MIRVLGRRSVRGTGSHSQPTSESLATPAGPSRCPALWAWTVSESPGSADPCANLLAGPRLRLTAGRAGVPVLLSEAVPRDHNLPQGLSVWAILPFRAVSRADRQVTSACRPSHLVSPTGPDLCCFFQVPLARLGALASGRSFGHSS
jgi:hypothetical protein